MIKIKDTKEYQRLFDKYGSSQDPVKFLSKWEHWATYRSWQYREGLRDQ